MVRRWMLFNGVGLLGFVVQLSTLAVLVHGCGWHYLAATAVGVEAAILHNFIWHDRVTWRVRRARGTRAMLVRIGRYHLLNGLVSLVGNVALTAALVGGLDMEPVAANAIAVLACSLVNFAGSEWLVFRAAVLPLVLLLSPGFRTGVEAAEGPPPSAPTLAAWEKYERAVSSRYRQADTTGPFFVHDVLQPGSGWRASARAGEIAMVQAQGAVPGGPASDVPGGRIHHWVGAVFIPGADLKGVLAMLVDGAGSESEAYEDVVDSRLLSRDGNRLRVFMKLKRDAPLLTVVYNTVHEVEYRTLGSARASSHSSAVKIAELADAGTPAEREKPAGRDSGFLWRLNAYWRYEQLQDGVLIECESLSLSRDIPRVMRPFVTGIVSRLARESLATTLRTLRARAACHAGRRAGC